MIDALDLFAGPGGWDLGGLAVGIDALGIEFDDAACATREAAGLRTLQGDVAALDPVGLWAQHVNALRVADWKEQGEQGPRPRKLSEAECMLLIASPPCQAWSMAGNRKGELDKQLVYKAANRIAEGEAFDDLAERCEDARSMLVVEPLRWALELRPTLLVFEQVPPVLNLWRYFGELLREHDYNVWAGILEAERYGVPQTRKRAILMASSERYVHPPEPSHQRYVKGEAPRGEDGLLPWVSMAEALGWGAGEEVNTGRDWKQGGLRADAQSFDADGQPAPTIDGKGRWRIGFPRQSDRADDEGPYRDRDFRGEDEPAFTVTEKARSAVKLVANDQPNASVREDTEPAPTITGGHDHGERVWVNGTHEKAGRRSGEEPAPTVHFGERLNTVEWEVTDTGETRGKGEVTTDGRKRGSDEPAPSMTTRADQLERRRVAMDPRAAMGQGMIERHGPRAPVDEGAPAPVITSKARSAEWVVADDDQIEARREPPACGCDWDYIDAGGFCACCEAHLDDPDGLYALQGDPSVHRDPNCPRRSELVSGPAPTITTTRKSDRGMLVGRQLPEGEGRNVGGHGWTDERPATTVAGDPRVHPPGHKVDIDAERGDRYEQRRGANAVRVSLDEAAILQGFPPGYPWQGTRTKQFEQVGNAVPPPLAAATLAALLEAAPELAAEAHAGVTEATRV